MSESIGNSVLFAVDKIKGLELTEKAEELSERFQLAAEDNRVKLQANFEKLNVLLNSGGIIRLRLLKAFPRLKNARDNNALNEMKRYLENRINKRMERKNGDSQNDH